MEKSPKLPNFEIVKPLVNDIYSGLKTVFEEEMVLALYLGGSLAIGGFDEEKSDLDFLVVLKDAPSTAELAKLRTMHESIRASHKNRLYSNYEGVYLTLDQVRSPKNANMHAPHLGSEGHFDVEDHGPELLIDLWKIRKSGFVVFGSAPETLIGEISTDEMLQAKVALFKSWWLPKLNRREPMDSEYQAYAVLTMTRILYGLANHDEVSKKESAKWCMAKYDQYRDLIAQALSWKSGDELHELDQVYSLIDYVNEHTH